MSANPFFERPIRNSPYELPARHWELDTQGQPTQQIIERRREAKFVSPVPKPKKHKKQELLVFEDEDSLSTAKQLYEQTELIQAVREQVDRWRTLSNPNDWKVTPETARLLQHWRQHEFIGSRILTCTRRSAIGKRLNASDPA